MLKKIMIVLAVAAILAFFTIPLWTSHMADKAFEKPEDPNSPVIVEKAIRIKKSILSFREARKFSEKAILYFPESEQYPGFIFSAAFCNNKLKNHEAAIHWYTMFLEQYPKHMWAEQAEASLTRLKGMHDVE